jgi:outer membrane protein
MNTKLATIALGLSLALPLAAYADDAGANGAGDHPNSARIGLYYVIYDAQSNGISGPYVPPGLGVGVENLVTLYVAYVRTLSSHWDAELAFGYPPLTKSIGKGPATVGSVPFNDQVISTARWIAPSLLLEYEFFGPQHRLRPYVGVGVNYTKFFDRQSTAAGNAVSGGPTAISLPSSIGPAFTLGLGYRITEQWHLYASYSVAQVNSKLTADTAGVLRTSEIHFWPNAIVLSVGYSF